MVEEKARDVFKGIPKVANVEKELEKEGKLEKARIWELPGLEDAFDGLEDIAIGPEQFGHIRKGAYHIEFGGPKVDYTGFFFTDICDDPDEVEDGKVTLYGPDVNEILPESTVPFGLHMKTWGENLSHWHMEYAGRVLMTGLMTMEGWMVTGGPFEPWFRVSKKAAPKYNFGKFAQMLRAYAVTTTPLMEKVEMLITIGSPTVGLVEGAAEPVPIEVIKEIRGRIQKKEEFYDAWTKELGDEDVDTFYGCTLCKMIAPNHACVVSPSIIPYCGFATWSGLKTTYEVEPGGYVSSIKRGKLVDADLGWYEGVDKEMYEISNEHYLHFFINSAIVYPATNCGCFEGASFYIPEVDGIGITARRYTGDTPLGVPFSTLAGFMSGGEQNHGFKGVSMRNITMPGFLRGDGGWNRIVWIAKEIKDEVAEAIPEEVYDKIATEEDVIDPDDLKEWLREKDHPIVRKFWSQTGGEPDPLTLPPPDRAWPDEEFKKAVERVKKAKEL
jgi:acetyl-CoA decarbonylase/synthase complex subunit beta